MMNNFSFFLVFFVFSTSVSAAAFHDTHSLDPLNFILGNKNLGPLKGEILGGAEAPGPSSNEPRTPLLLAGNRTRRPDILRRFKVYKGGWDISNKHYWASVGFTGGAAFVIAVIWLVLFGVALLFHRCFSWRINFRGKGSVLSRKIHPTLLILFTCASVVGCLLFSVGQDKLHTEVLQTLSYVVNQSDYTAQMLRNVTDYLSLAKSVEIPQFELPQSVMQDIDELSARLTSGAETLTEKTNANSAKVRRVFNTVRSTLITVAVVMLVLVIVGLVISLLGRQHVIHIFIFTGWITVAVTLTLCGIFVIFNSAISDSCVAMQEWVENPQAETALSNILPCVDERSTNQTLLQSRNIVRSLVNDINTFIYTEANTDRPPSDQFYYNQSGPQMPILCFPFNDNMQDRECASQDVSMTNASVVWEKYVCSTSLDGKTCTSTGRLTPAMYSQLVLGVTASYAVLHYTPSMLDLQNCNFLRHTFMAIASTFCPPMEHYLLEVVVGLSLISGGITLCLILWLVYANRPQREEVFVKFMSIKGSGDGGESVSRNAKDVGVSIVPLVVTSPSRVAPVGLVLFCL